MLQRSPRKFTHLGILHQNGAAARALTNSKHLNSVLVCYLLTLQRKAINIVFIFHFHIQFQRLCLAARNLLFEGFCAWQPRNIRPQTNPSARLVFGLCILVAQTLREKLRKLACIRCNASSTLHGIPSWMGISPGKNR